MNNSSNSAKLLQLKAKYFRQFVRKWEAKLVSDSWGRVKAFSLKKFLQQAGARRIEEIVAFNQKTHLKKIFSQLNSGKQKQNQVAMQDKIDSYSPYYIYNNRKFILGSDDIAGNQLDSGSANLLPIQAQSFKAGIPQNSPSTWRSVVAIQCFVECIQQLLSAKKQADIRSAFMNILLMAGKTQQRFQLQRAAIDQNRQIDQNMIEAYQSRILSKKLQVNSWESLSLKQEIQNSLKNFRSQNQLVREKYRHNFVELHSGLSKLFTILHKIFLRNRSQFFILYKLQNEFESSKGPAIFALQNILEKKYVSNLQEGFNRIYNSNNYRWLVRQSIGKLFIILEKKIFCQEIIQMMVAFYNIKLHYLQANLRNPMEPRPSGPYSKVLDDSYSNSSKLSGSRFMQGEERSGMRSQYPHRAQLQQRDFTSQAQEQEPYFEGQNSQEHEFQPPIRHDLSQADTFLSQIQPKPGLQTKLRPDQDGYKNSVTLQPTLPPSDLYLHTPSPREQLKMKDSTLSINSKRKGLECDENQIEKVFQAINIQPVDNREQIIKQIQRQNDYLENKNEYSSVGMLKDKKWDIMSFGDKDSQQNDNFEQYI